MGAFAQAWSGCRAVALSRRADQRVGALRAGDPEVLVEVREALMADLAAGILAGDLHVAVCFEDGAAEPRAQPGLQRREFGREPMDAAGARTTGSLAAARSAWTRWPRTPGPRRRADHLVYRSCVAAGFEPRIAYITRDPLAIRGLVAARLAVTLVPRLLAGQLSGIRILRLSGDVTHRRLYALTRARRPAGRAGVRRGLAWAVAGRV
jgi:DNA-binding transcriptional LysR family regulator